MTLGRGAATDEILRFAAVLRPVQYFVLGLLLLLLALPSS